MLLAEGPGIARGKKMLRKKIFKCFFILLHPLGHPWVSKKCQHIQSSRLAGYRQHIYTNVLFYYIDYSFETQLYLEIKLYL